MGGYGDLTTECNDFFRFSSNWKDEDAWSSGLVKSANPKLPVFSTPEALCKW